MEIGEAAAVNIANSLHDQECYFCNAKPNPDEVVNELTDEHDEDADADLDGSLGDYKFKNDAGKLGTALGGKPSAKDVILGSDIYQAAVAAHHLIPGNASLKTSQLFKSDKYLWKDGKAKGNIGYNINAGTNGVWSPGNYAVRPWGAGGSVFMQSGHQPIDFAIAAMEAWNCQFHDAHEQYSEFVRDVLNKIFDKLEDQEDIVCNEASAKKDRTPEERDPLVALISRLNTVSARMKKLLIMPKSNWRINVYTSRFSLEYMLRGFQSL